jgi:hypothetical protein
MKVTSLYGKLWVHSWYYFVYFIFNFSVPLLKHFFSLPLPFFSRISVFPFHFLIFLIVLFFRHLVFTL